mmetsp:Transcript_21410/g.68374  ORF Transcript_21410/g.68374 Transcript_21410/m.68374 type:complete len:157 (+) Transcript_21410:151-621(+)
MGRGNECIECGRRVEYKGMRCGPCAKAAGVARDEGDGRAKALYEKKNPINNPINNAKRADLAREEAEAWLRANGKTGVQTETQRKHIVDGIMQKQRPELGGLSIEEACSDPDFSLYVGYTGRSLLSTTPRTRCRCAARGAWPIRGASASESAYETG